MKIYIKQWNTEVEVDFNNPVYKYNKGQHIPIDKFKVKTPDKFLKNKKTSIYMGTTYDNEITYINKNGNILKD